MIKVAQVDAILDTVSDDENPGTALADMLDQSDDWDWSDEAEHGPEDRFAIVESSGAWWLVYRGSEDDEATRFATEQEAQSALSAQVEVVS